MLGLKRLELREAIYSFRVPLIKNQRFYQVWWWESWGIEVKEAKDWSQNDGCRKAKNNEEKLFPNKFCWPLLISFTYWFNSVPIEQVAKRITLQQSLESLQTQVQVAWHLVLLKHYCYHRFHYMLSRLSDCVAIIIYTKH